LLKQLGKKRHADEATAHSSDATYTSSKMCKRPKSSASRGTDELEAENARLRGNANLFLAA